MAACIIVFAKNPIPGQVKTRLIPYLSPKQASSLYKAFLIDWSHALSEIPIADLVVAYTPSDALASLKSITGEDRIYIPQRGKDLGQRLISAARWAGDQGYNRFLFVGSDSPTLPIQYVERALDLLKSRDVVIGPSVDGGYYLIGFSTHGVSLAIPAIFESIAWSTNLVFRQTLDKIQFVDARLGILPPWYDVDTPAELQLLRDHLCGIRLAGKKSPAPETERTLRENEGAD